MLEPGLHDLKRGEKRLSHENFFVAKVCDSEAATRRISISPATQRDDDRGSIMGMRIQEVPAKRAFPAILTNADVDGCCTSCIVALAHHRFDR
ncbi:hypothetical protein MTX26_15750 [Bradyrhizobium sp. ISRA443]|uniref:hypothetical protein n=1 Tax=Bradyrhizobium sp. ISRA443 TaxID=2866198 RepID=UPI00247AA7F1|nr:hypothetical protein [Bradyrhizobium sp. ISRA443]WGS15956.1 hypothetical protein MTX26_15750 [Bradyrhizobium sp. ISRA443]